MTHTLHILVRHCNKFLIGKPTIDYEIDILTMARMSVGKDLHRLLFYCLLLHYQVNKSELDDLSNKCHM